MAQRRQQHDPQVDDGGTRYRVRQNYANGIGNIDQRVDFITI